MRLQQRLAIKLNEARTIDASVCRDALAFDETI
jgi:hypothetical protein